MKTSTPPDAPPGTGQSHYLSLRGLRFHYVSWGRPGLPVLVALHGLRSYAQTFEELAARLDDRFHILSLDQRGRGQSDWDAAHQYDTLNYVADLEAFVDALGLQRFHLLGHSMGGANAIVYAARHPLRVASLIVEDMGPGASAGSAGAERIKRELANTPAAFDNWTLARQFWRSIRPAVSEAAIDSRVVFSLKQAGDGRVVWRHDQNGIAAARLAIAPLDLWPSVDAIQAPTLLIRGARSDFLSEATATQMVARNARLTHLAIEDAGHYVHDDAPQAFVDAVERFLSQQR